ncbi:unnamed protein product [Pleuronectes platessa]|uniref:Uncharacterized protein n=1 Tax=Pleuronectes platessa TaxID=8262 RepID=A0A9N7VEE4_PLEPL|nr:unnamed protein product [Pleuronectes platessa]
MTRANGSPIAKVPKDTLSRWRCGGERREETGSVDKVRLCHKDSSVLGRRVMTVTVISCGEWLKYEEDLGRKMKSSKRSPLFLE